MGVISKSKLKELASRYSKSPTSQIAFIEGFQAAVNIVKAQIETCYMDEFVDVMEQLTEVYHYDLQEVFDIVEDDKDNE